MDIFSLFTGGAAGAITGLLGSVATSITNYKMQKLKNVHDREMAKIEGENILKEAQANIQITQAKTEGEIAVKDMDALSSSLKDVSNNLFDKNYMEKLMEGNSFMKIIGSILAFLFGIVDWLTRFARPALTYYLAGASTYITILAYKIIQDKEIILTVEQAYALFQQCVIMILYMTSTIISWWFCDRQLTKFAAKVFGK